MKTLLFIHPDVGSALQVTASQTKIAPSAHVHAVLAVTGLHFLNTHSLTNCNNKCSHVSAVTGRSSGCKRSSLYNTTLTRSFNRRHVNCVQSHKKRITCQIKPEPLVTSALFSLNHIFSLSSDTNTNTHSVDSLCRNQSVHPNCMPRVCLVMQIWQLLAFGFTLMSTLAHKRDTLISERYNTA